MKVLYLESVAGIAGDMFVSGFVDAGLVTVNELQALVEKLGFSDVAVEFTKVTKASMQGTQFKIEVKSDTWQKHFFHANKHALVKKHHQHSASHRWHTHFVDLDWFLETTRGLEDSTRRLARKIFRAVADAEAASHGIGVQEVAFHEVGAVDSILDVVFAAYCVSKVAPDKIVASPIKLGRGFIKMEHGMHPVPPPATARLSQGMPIDEVPVSITRENAELSTPTGVAILKALEPEFQSSWPMGKPQAQGMGCGTMDLGDFPNVFRVVVMDQPEKSIDLPYERDEIIEIACNIDDETAEKTAFLAEKLLANGALDVWQTPVMGKKGRVATLLTVLTDISSWPKHADFLLRHSTTFGIRYRRWDRLKLARKFRAEVIEGTQMRVKEGFTTDGSFVKEKTEFEDFKRLF